MALPRSQCYQSPPRVGLILSVFLLCLLDGSVVNSFGTRGTTGGDSLEVFSSPPLPCNFTVDIDVYVPTDLTLELLSVHFKAPFGRLKGRQLQMALSGIGIYISSPFGEFLENLTAWDTRGLPVPLTKHLLKGNPVYEVVSWADLAKLQFYVNVSAGMLSIDNTIVSSHLYPFVDEPHSSAPSPKLGAIPTPTSHVMLSGYATYLMVAGCEACAYRVTFHAPPTAQGADWQAIAALPRLSSSSAPPGSAPSSVSARRSNSIPSVIASATETEIAAAQTESETETSVTPPAMATFWADNLVLLLDSPVMLGVNITSLAVQHPHLAPLKPASLDRANIGSSGDDCSCAAEADESGADKEAEPWQHCQCLHVWAYDAFPDEMQIELLVTAQNISMGALWPYGLATGPFRFPALLDASASRHARASASASSPYRVFFEMYGPSANNGWALEHGHCFQAVDNVTRDYTPVMIAFHMTHHQTHSFWLPRRLYTDALYPPNQVLATRSGFVWFAEGWAQYLAWQAVARYAFTYLDNNASTAISTTTTTIADRVTEEEVEAQYAQANVLFYGVTRLATAYLCEAPPPSARPLSMIEMSLQQFQDQTYWTYMYSSGALLALWLDQRMVEHASTASSSAPSSSSPRSSPRSSIASSATASPSPPSSSLTAALLALLKVMPDYPLGIPEDEFEAVWHAVTGEDVRALFAQYVRGTTPLPVEAILAGLGVHLTANCSDSGTIGFEILRDADLSPSVRHFRATQWQTVYAHR